VTAVIRTCFQALRGRVRQELCVGNERYRSVIIIRAIIKSVTDFVNEDGQMLAGAISCFFMLSFIPFFIFLVTVLGFVLGGHEGFKTFVLDHISGFFPAIASEISDELTLLIKNSEVGLFTLLGYLFFSYHLYVSLDTAVNQVFELPGKRSVLGSAANAFFVITILMGLVMVVFGTTIVLSVLVHLGELLNLPRIHVVVSVAGILAPLVLVFLTSAALYTYLPRARVSVSNAAKGAVFTAFLIEAAKYAFTFYVAIKLAQFGAFYGSLTGVIIFFMWLLYSASIFLVGAGIVHNLEIAKAE
jgi:membrane protein